MKEFDIGVFDGLDERLAVRAVESADQDQIAFELLRKPVKMLSTCGILHLRQALRRRSMCLAISTREMGLTVSMALSIRP